MRYRLTIEAENAAELAELIRLAASLRVQPAAVPAAMPSIAGGGTTAQHAAGVPECPNGHGPMRYRAGGTIKSGERLGQAYPAFYSCGECRATIDAA